MSGEWVLRLCEDTTGLPVSPSDRRLARGAICVWQLRREALKVYAKCIEGQDEAARRRIEGALGDVGDQGDAA